MKIISKIQGITPNGHYSPAIVHNGTVYISGQFAIDPITGEKKFGTIEEETRQVLENIQVILKAAGSDKTQVLRSNIYIADIAQWGAVDRLYAEFFGSHRPARTVITAKEIHFGFQLEMDVIAAVVEE